MGSESLELSGVGHLGLEDFGWGGGGGGVDVEHGLVEQGAETQVRDKAMLLAGQARPGPRLVGFARVYVFRVAFSEFFALGVPD